MFGIKLQPVRSPRRKQSPTPYESGLLSALERPEEVRMPPEGFSLIGNVLLADTFWNKGLEPSVSQPEHAALEEALSGRFSEYVEKMRTMPPQDRDRISYLLLRTAKADVSVNTNPTVDELMYPQYLVCNSDEPGFSSYTLSQSPVKKGGGLQLFDLSQEGGQDFMDQLRQRGFVYPTFQDS